LNPELSIIVTAKDTSDELYRDFLSSVRMQSFTDYEIITVTEGDSESAKAIGLKQAKGEIVGIFASDNFLDDPNFLKKCLEPFWRDEKVIASYPIHYSYMSKDNALNRYFSLLGVNDLIPFYLGKADKMPISAKAPSRMAYQVLDIHKVRTIGDNGTFVRKKILDQADIKNYYHIDVFQDLFDKGYHIYALVNTSLWHRTGGNIFKFFWRRLKYADKFMTSKRRWKMVTKKDIPKLVRFIIGTLLIVPRLIESILGFCYKHDVAWFLHWPVCMLTIITYGLLCIKRLLPRW